MSEQVKAGLVIAMGIVVAVLVYSWATAYYSPHEKCILLQLATEFEDKSYEFLTDPEATAWAVRT